MGKFNIATRGKAGTAWPLVREFITLLDVNCNLFYVVLACSSYFDSPCAIVTAAHYSLSYVYRMFSHTLSSGSPVTFPMQRACARCEHYILIQRVAARAF